MINKLSQAISSTIELEEVLGIGAERVVDLLRLSQSRVFLLKEGSEELQILYKYDKTTQHGDGHSPCLVARLDIHRRIPDDDALLG